MDSFITIGHLQRELRFARLRMLNEGRLTMTLSEGGADISYINHWLRKGVSSFEDCIAVAAGSPDQCLAGLRRYVRDYRSRAEPGKFPTREELDATLGLVEPAPHQIAAE